MSQPWLWVKRSVPGVHIKIAIGFKWIFIPPKDGVNFSWCFAIPTCIISDGYPLVIKHSYWKWWFIVDFPIAWWFSIVMLVYQRVNPHISWFGFPNHVLKFHPAPFESQGDTGSMSLVGASSMVVTATLAFASAETHANYRKTIGKWWFNEGLWWFNGIYPLVNIQKTMENHQFQWVNPLFQWAIFNS